MKLAQFAQILKKKKLDAAILFGRDGVTEHAIEYFCDAYPLSSVYLIIQPTKKATTYVPALEVERMRKSSKIPIKILKEGWEKGIRGNRFGFNAVYLSVSELKVLKKLFVKASFVDISKELRSLRDIKTNIEISRIKIACKKGDKILNELIPKLKKLGTEQNAARWLVDRISAEGLELSFPPIIAAGSNSARPHHVPKNDKIRGWVVIDMGVRYKGYCSDITRMVHVGQASKKEVEIYQKLQKAQQVGLRFARPGIKGRVLHEKVQEALGPLKKYFIHGTGHAIGLEVHDPGTGVHAKEKGSLCEGMIVTIEPGVYFSGKFGMRIEDTLLITKKGCLPLTTFPKQFIVI